ncbi:MAG: DUF1795 domain-containing protein [Chloracidobacterium sp.]|nr:DUF1795 domain-containing protein [Chloracidobacterium sp.]
MRIYGINEGYFEIPEEWSDRSVNVFSASGDLPGDFSLVITRESLEDNQNFESYVDEQLNALSKTLSRFKLTGKYAASVDRAPALNAEFTWETEGKRMVQRQVYVKCNRQALVFTATTVERFSQEYWQTIDNILTTFRMSRFGFADR